MANIKKISFENPVFVLSQTTLTMSSTLRRVHPCECDVRDNLAFFVEIVTTFNAIKSSFERPYDTQTFYQDSNLCCFLVSVSVLFHLLCDYIYLVRFR